MNGRTNAWLDLAALPPVAPYLFDARPAMVFRGDGSAILWANAAALAFLGAPDLGALLDRRFARTAALAVHLARLAKALPTGHDRVEMLRFSFGVTQSVLAAACRSLDLGGGARAVLVVGVAGGPRESLSTRAERLADALAGTDSLAAVLDGGGRVLGASGGFDALEPASATLDALILDAGRGDRPVLRRTIHVGTVARDAGVVRAAAGEERLFVLVVGPGQDAVAPSAALAPASPELPVRAPEPQAETQTETETSLPLAAPAADVSEVSPQDVAATSPPAAGAAAAVDQEDDAVDVTPPSAPPPLRFLWSSDAAGAFTFVSAELPDAVGRANAPGSGETWKALAARLGLSGDDPFGDALRSVAGFGDVTVWWPVAGTEEAVAIDLDGIPEFGRDRVFRGYRGFGVIRGEARRPAPPAPAAAAPPPASTTPPEVPPAPLSPLAADGGEDLDDVARERVEGALSAGAGTPPLAPPPDSGAGMHTVPEPIRSNVVHISAPPTRILPRRLSGNEEDAFRRIAEALGARVVEAAPAEAVASAAEAVARSADTAILDRLPVGVAVYRDGRTLYANRALLDLLGYGSVDAFLAAGGTAAIFPEDPKRDRHAAADPGRLDAIRSDGKHVAVEARLHAVPWSGSTAMMLSLVRAAAEPAAAAAAPEPGPEVDDDALFDRIHELETILDTATDGVLIIDGDGRIASLNRTAEALFGVEALEVAGAPFTDLLAEESRKAAIDYIDGLSQNGVASVLNDGREVIGRVPRGGLIPLFMTIGRLGESAKYCAVLRDITHWKNVEEELVAARRAAESANAQKSEFLAKISHEIRTPLNAIIGFSEVMMEERFGAIGSERYRSYLRDIHLSGEHLMSLINDLLDLSKVEAGKLDLNFEAVSLNDVIRECVALMQPQANRERIIIRSSLSSTVPSVVADLRSLRQILLNILSNAIKFTRSGGQVIVATALEDSGEVVVRIRDTGIGMSASDIDTAMKPFRQVATSGRPHEGTGLGLPLTKALVEANRASFAIDSVPDQGTLVRVTFPTTRVLAG